MNEVSRSIADSQARNAGDANKAQGEASVFCERNPGLTRKESQAHEVGARNAPELLEPSPLRFNGRASITRFAGSLLLTTIPRVSLRASLRFGAPLHPGLYSGRPHSRAGLPAIEPFRTDGRQRVRRRQSWDRDRRATGRIHPIREAVRA
jgi:hypothetical protein